MDMTIEHAINTLSELVQFRTEKGQNHSFTLKLAEATNAVIDLWNENQRQRDIINQRCKDLSEERKEKKQLLHILGVYGFPTDALVECSIRADMIDPALTMEENIERFQKFRSIIFGMQESQESLESSSQLLKEIANDNSYSDATKQLHADIVKMYEKDLLEYAADIRQLYPNCHFTYDELLNWKTERLPF